MSEEGKLDALTTLISEGFARQDARAERLESTVDTLVEDGKASNQRMTRIEVRMDGVESRATTNSMRVRATSENDLTQDAELAKEKLAREALALRVETIEGMVKEIRGAVVGFFTNKKVLFVGKVIFAAAVAYSGLHGLKVLP